MAPLILLLNKNENYGNHCILYIYGKPYFEEFRLYIYILKSQHLSRIQFNITKSIAHPSIIADTFRRNLKLEIFIL